MVTGSAFHAEKADVVAPDDRDAKASECVGQPDVTDLLFIGNLLTKAQEKHRKALYHHLAAAQRSA
jgi:hypothetical protein